MQEFPNWWLILTALGSCALILTCFMICFFIYQSMTKIQKLSTQLETILLNCEEISVKGKELIDEASNLLEGIKSPIQDTAVILQKSASWIAGFGEKATLFAYGFNIFKRVFQSKIFTKKQENKKTEDSEERSK